MHGRHRMSRSTEQLASHMAHAILTFLSQRGGQRCIQSNAGVYTVGASVTACVDHPAKTGVGDHDVERKDLAPVTRTGGRTRCHWCFQ